MMTFDGTPCCKLFEGELKHNHCCNQMTEYIHDKRIPIMYDSRYREYAINMVGSSLQGITFCPWCSKKLPQSLRDTYFDILEQEYQMFEGVRDQERKNFPKEFKTDEWWKKRGL